MEGTDLADAPANSGPQPLLDAEHTPAGSGEAAVAEQIQQQQAADASGWGGVTLQGVDLSHLPQLHPSHLELLQAQQQLLQQSQQQSQEPQPAHLTPEQLAALTGALGGQNLAALTGALNGTAFENNELLQRLMVAPAGASAEQPAGLQIQLPRAPDLVSTSLAMDGALPGSGVASDAVASSATPAAPPTLTSELGASAATSQPQQLAAEQPTPDAVAAAVAAAAAAAAAGSVGAGQLAGVDAELQLQLQRGVKRKAGEGDPPADSDVADILLAMAHNPALKNLQGAAAGATAQQLLAGLGAQAGAAVTDGSGGPAEPAAAVQDGAAAVHPDGDVGTASAEDVAAQSAAINMTGSLQDLAAGGVLDIGGSLANAALAGQLAGVSAGLPGLQVGMQGLGGGVLQIADLTRLPMASGALGAAAHGYAAVPGMQTLQLVQLPLAAGGGLAAALQPAVVDELGRAAKRARVDGDGDGGAAAAAGDGAGGGGPAEGAAADSAGMDAAAISGAAAAGEGSSEAQPQQLDGLQPDNADANAAAAAAAAAATALGTVVNVNGVNMLIPAAPQLQLQLAADANMQDQLLALQQQVQLAHIPVVSGLGGVQLPAGVTNLANASPEQMQHLQQQLQIQQQIQHLQLQQQLQLMQLQLASQQGIVIAPGPRLAGIDADAGGHMVRRHGMLPERLVTRDMLKQVFHLPIEEAAKSLGIGQTMLKHYCRKFGIPRWPYRKRQSVVQLIASIENYAVDKPMVVEPALMKLKQFLAQIDEDPTIDLDGPIKRLRQAFFKEAYKARVRKQQSETGDDGRGRGGRNMARSEAWLENLCQAILDSEPGVGSGQHHLGHHDGGMGMGDGDDMGDEMGPSTAEELAVAAAMHAHAAAQHAGAVGDHAGLDPSTLAASMAAAAQLAQLPVSHEALAQGLDNDALMAAAAAAAAAAHAQHPHQHQQVGVDQMAALEAAAAAAVAAAQQQG